MVPFWKPAEVVVPDHDASFGSIACTRSRRAGGGVGVAARDRTSGHYLHYEPAPGRWDDVDLNLRAVGADFVMDRHDLAVRVGATRPHARHAP